MRWLKKILLQQYIVYILLYFLKKYRLLHNIYTFFIRKPDLTGPPPQCSVERSLNQKNRWAPYDFFRLFCTSRTCSPKSAKAPFQ